MSYLDYIKTTVENYFNCDLIDNRPTASMRLEVAIFCKLATALTLSKPTEIARLIRLHPKTVNTLACNISWKILNDKMVENKYLVLENQCNEFIKKDIKNKRLQILERSKSLLK